MKTKSTQKMNNYLIDHEIQKRYYQIKNKATIRIKQIRVKVKIVNKKIMFTKFKQINYINKKMEIYLKKVMKSIMSHQIQVAPLKAKARVQNQVQAAIKYFLRKSRDTESDLQTPQKNFRIFPDRMAGLLITLLKKKRKLIKMKIKVRNQKKNPIRILS